MLIPKHARNWSYETLERAVRANVVYRSFCRIGVERVPDARTLVRLGQAVGPEAIREIHDRLVAIGQERRVVRGRKMRAETTVVESNIHYPTPTTAHPCRGNAPTQTWPRTKIGRLTRLRLAPHCRRIARE